MLMTNWAKIDKFYLAYIISLALFAALSVFTLKSIFSAYDLAYEIKQSDIDSGLKIDKAKLNEAYNWIFSKDLIKLDL